jgi:hypothetical protein
MSQVAVVHYMGATARSLTVVASVVADLRDDGNDVSVVDLEPTTTIRQGFPPATLVRLLGHSVKPRAFGDALRSLGARYQLLPVVSDDRAVPQEHVEPLEVAVESELLTYFRLDHIPRSREARNLQASLLVNAVRSYWSLRALWSANAPDEVLVPNGRTSRQKAARLVAESLDIPVRLYENGRAQKNSYYLGTTQPHDRIASQAEVGSLTSSLSQEKVHELAGRWLTSRMAGLEGTNSFSANWELFRQSHGGSNGTTAVFFASSFDEFLAFGPMWTIDEWSSQFEAFDVIMSVLEKRGIDLVLRLHPNLSSKSRQYFLREVEEIVGLQKKHPSLTIHWHNSPVNSYQLVAEADYVFVERSTIGLEASLMGTPVWVTQATQWDQVADIRQLLTPADVTEEALTPWTPSPLGAERFVAYWMIQEHPLRYEASDWASWDPENAPATMKALQLALPNSWRHKGRLLSLEWSKWRNSRFRPPSSPMQEQ